jgi:hypothetical protein
MSAVPQLIKALIDYAGNSERSNQLEVGPSELGSCKRQMFYKLNGQGITNPNTFKMASILGTAIHTHIQEVIDRLDPNGTRFLTEMEMKTDEIKGHIDLYDQETKEVIDWKTTTKKNLGYFPSKSQRWQVQVYGYLLEANGYKVENVSLVCIPRDGTELDIIYHTEAYDKVVALEALQWLDNIRALEQVPDPEKDPSFCKGYCSFYDITGKAGCMGRPKGDGKDLPMITDELMVLAAKEYLNLGIEIKELEKKQDMAKATLEGINGQTSDGIKVTWTEVAGRSTIDEAEVLKSLGFVPKKTGRETYRLSVKE